MQPRSERRPLACSPPAPRALAWTLNRTRTTPSCTRPAISNLQSRTHSMRTIHSDHRHLTIIQRERANHKTMCTHNQSRVMSLKEMQPAEECPRPRQFSPLGGHSRTRVGGSIGFGLSCPHVAPMGSRHHACSATGHPSHEPTPSKPTFKRGTSERHLFRERGCRGALIPFGARRVPFRWRAPPAHSQARVRCRSGASTSARSVP